MNVYLLRHGKAEDTPPGMRDRDRRLTAEGIESLKAELPGIRSRIAEIDFILTSPYPRARETAEIVAEAYGIVEKVENYEALATHGTESLIIRKLASLPADCSVVLVGHSPILEDIACYMSRGARDIALKKGGLCGISFSGRPAQDAGELLWLLKPSELKA